jgi:hypothetical protein
VVQAKVFVWRVLTRLRTRRRRRILTSVRRRRRRRRTSCQTDWAERRGWTTRDREFCRSAASRPWKFRSAHVSGSQRIFISAASTYLNGTIEFNVKIQKSRCHSSMEFMLVPPTIGLFANPENKIG